MRLPGQLALFEAESVPPTQPVIRAPAPFGHLMAAHYRVILADPPWRFRTWDNKEAIPRGRSSGTNVSAAVHYETLPIEDIARLPVGDLAAEDCCLFLWVTWPNLIEAIEVMQHWGFIYKTAAFVWTKAHVNQIEMFREDGDTLMGMGYWTRANTEACLLGTRGNPKRLDAGIRQGIIEPRREHSRKPDCVRERIERLVAGPFVELFARSQREGWDCHGDQTEKFK